MYRRCYADDANDDDRGVGGTAAAAATSGMTSESFYSPTVSRPIGMTSTVNPIQEIYGDGEGEERLFIGRPRRKGDGGEGEG